jgi:hypothetical protein
MESMWGLKWFICSVYILLNILHFKFIKIVDASLQRSSFSAMITTQC